MHATSSCFSCIYPYEFSSNRLHVHFVLILNFGFVGGGVAAMKLQLDRPAANCAGFNSSVLLYF